MEPFAGSSALRDIPNEKEDAKSTLVTWDGPDDPENPQNWPRTKKVGVTALLGFTTMSATFASSIFSSASPYVAKQYGISSEVGILGLSLYLLGFTVGPIVFGPVSEVYGRKIAILPAVFIFICFSAATATAENLQTIFISRFFAGGFASSPVSVVGGAMADFWSQRERGGAIVIYSLCVVAGPSLAPLIGSAISESYLTWRWTEYVCVILTSTVLAFNLLFLPETSAPILLTGKARRLRFETKNWALHSAHEELDHSLTVFMHKNLVTPLAMLAKEPMVTLIATYNAFAYGVLYLLFAAIPIIFEEVRGWKPVPATLPNLATFVGTLIAAAINGYYSGKIFVRYLDTHGGKAPPEKRLPPMMIGAITFPVGFFIVGWTSNPSIHWFPSLIGFTLIGMSFLLIFQSGMNYLVDAYTRVAASAVSANTFLRSLFGATFPLFAKPLFNNLGVSWACTLLGCIAVLLGLTPIMFTRYGQRLREKSKFIPS
ncbi:major facilitator superfamily domain-containing protein [Naematelia encephala]|uniref:Major facilitator superfamily domain-containing protein n=1 Tax=Naematelia encephala TaxID=71784 RepID=A0A1Y2BB41_9TREE|nr:major facilitator superfamily domain-containing protein [Naematelia encephala]